MEKINSRRRLQKISREERLKKCAKDQDLLMNTHFNNISQVCSTLKKIRGEENKYINIPFIETLCGTYTGDNVLEGFRANCEILCNEIGEDNSLFLQDFYNRCIEDNKIIYEITKNDCNQIQHMSLQQLKNIIFKILKLKKACDVNMLTVEHLRFAGDKTLLILLDLLNKIIDQVSHLSSPQLNTAIATVVYKQKDKLVSNHKSHRLVRVCPLLGRIVNEYMRPELIKITRPGQNQNQYGFTKGISYLLAALQRHETEKFCIDTKKTFFTVTLDGASAFEVVNREIQTRELYCAG